VRTRNGDLIVVLPGILGSRLSRRGRSTWRFRQPIRDIGRLSRSLTENLALDPIAYQDREYGCDDGTVVDGVMRSVAGMPRPTALRIARQLGAAIPGFWTLLGGYDLLLARLVHAFDARDIVAFPYDWRQSNRVSATRLRRQVEPLLRARRRSHPTAQLVLVGHSMGGLVARYYAECLDRQRLTARVITIGTPYQGAVKALAALADGRARLAAGPVAVDIPVGELLRSLPSVAELLPAYPCLGAGPGDLAAIGPETSVPGLPPAIRDHALDFQREVADAIVANGPDRPVYSPILSHRQPTAWWASLGADGIEPHGGDCAALGGDGTVARPSAIPPEWVDRGGGSFANARHAALHNAAGTWDQLLGLLTGGAPRRRMGRPVELVVDAAEGVVAGGNWTVAARAAGEAGPLALAVELVGPDGEVRRAPLQPDGSGYVATLEIGEPGLYRWEVAPDQAGNTIAGEVSDVLVCAAP
jgi:pimeloyl-ACP methyl ester carboxylesterase